MRLHVCTVVPESSNAKGIRFNATGVALRDNSGHDIYARKAKVSSGSHRPGSEGRMIRGRTTVGHVLVPDRVDAEVLLSPDIRATPQRMVPVRRVTPLGLTTQGHR